MRILLILLCLPGLLNAQTWTRPKGGGYYQLGGSYIEGDRIYNRSGPELQLRRSVRDITLQSYLEYGLTERVMVTGVIPFKLLRTGTKVFDPAYLPDTLAAGQLNRWGNINLGCVYGIRQGGKWVLSGKLQIDTRSAHFEPAIGLRSGYDAWGLGTSLSAGTSGNSFFGTLELGLRLRTHQYSKQLFSTGQLGYRFAQKHWLILAVDLLDSLLDGSFDDGTSNHTGLYLNDLEYTAIQMKLGIRVVKDVHLWLAAGGGFSGHAVARAPAFSIAVSYTSE